MVKRGSSTFSSTAVARSGLALGRSVEKTLTLEAEVSGLRHHISVLSCRLHLSALESESLRCELDALGSVASRSSEGDRTDAPSPLRKVADVVAVHAPVAVLAAPTVASLGAHVEASLGLLWLPLSWRRSLSPMWLSQSSRLNRLNGRRQQMGRLPDITRIVSVGWTMRLVWLLGRLDWLKLLSRRLLRFPLVITVSRWLRLLGGEDPIIMLVILVLLPSAIIGVGRGVAGAMEIMLDFFCRVWVTGLPECGLGCGYDLACGSI